MQLIKTNHQSHICAEQGHINGVSINGGTSRSAGGKDGFGTVTVRAGGVVRIDLQISGSPPPVVTWSKNNQSLTSSNKVS